MDSASNKVLVFGLDSFTGKHLSAYLRNAGFLVYGTVLKKMESDTTFHCDITDKDSISTIIAKVSPDYIINLAAISFVGQANRELFYKINVLGVENILEAIVEANCSPKKVILVSSATVYGNQDNYVLNENMVPNPVNHYGISKLAMEQIAKTYFDKLNIVITRPFNYTGTGQEEHFLIPKIISHYQDKKTDIELGNIEVFREFNDISFVCEIYQKFLTSSIKSEIVNICSNRLIALKEVITTMDDIAGYDINIQVNPKFVRKNEIISLSGSTDKLFKLLGDIEQIAFKETLLNMYSHQQ